MKNAKNWISLGLLFLLFIFPVILISQEKSQPKEYPILINGKLNPLVKLGVGVDDSHHLRNWLAETVEGLEIKYPGNLQWGAIFITSGGDAVPPPRDKFAVDISKYEALVVEMRGETGGECVMVGIKDADDPDNGSEPKEIVKLEKNWKTYTFNIDSTFGNRPPNLSKLTKTKLYVVAEFIFPCESNNAQTVYVKNIKYIK